MRFWYLSHRRPVKAQVSLRICAVSLEPSLFAHVKYGSRRRVLPKIRHLAVHMRLKNVFTEDEKSIISWVSSIMRTEILTDFEIKKEILKQMSHVTRKPVFAICEQQRRRSASQPHSLIRAFVVPCLDSIIPRLATAEISRLYLVSEAEQTGLSLTWSKTRRQVFSWRGSCIFLVMWFSQNEMLALVICVVLTSNQFWS